MRRILSERNLVVILFLLALIIFVFAQEDTRKIERMYMSEGAGVSSIVTPPEQSANLEIPAGKKTPVTVEANVISR